MALDLDNAVSLRLLKFDNEKDADNRKFWIRMLGGEVPDDDTVLDAQELIRNDKYADENTIVS